MENSFEWMAWTLPTLLFFLAIFLCLLTLIFAEVYFPTVKRKGLLPLPTTRGDRFFISLLLSAVIHLASVALTETAPWGGTVISAFLFLLIMKKG